MICLETMQKRQKYVIVRYLNLFSNPILMNFCHLKNTFSLCYRTAARTSFGYTSNPVLKHRISERKRV